MRRISVIFLGVMLFVATGFSKDWYVSKSTGKNKNTGTKEEPLKNIQKAIKKAKKGDSIHVAKGNYYGLMRKGYIELKKPLSLIGGYSADFASRDIVANRTMIAPPNKSNGTSSSKKLLTLNISGKDSKTLIDGFIFDRGYSNSYHETKGKPEGVETGMLLHGPSKNPKDASPSVKQAMIGGNVDGDITIQNCFFVNSGWYPIMFGIREGHVRILNNMFIANTMSSAEIWGKSAQSGKADMEFANNTVLFTWSRTKDLGDMGYGVRAMTKMNYNIHNNLIGLSSFAGIDNTRDDKDKKLKIDNNIFFLNKQADLTLPSGGGNFMRVKVDEFEDLEIDSSENNSELKDTATLKNAINRPYLEGFLNASYSEKTDFDTNSPANTFRSAMGLNKQGTMSTKVSMWANKYPLDEVFKLVGVVKNVGMQPVK